jgi:hypothetical protein
MYTGEFILKSRCGRSAQTKCLGKKTVVIYCLRMHIEEEFRISKVVY